jgi:acyl-CoA thioesterase-1
VTTILFFGDSLTAGYGLCNPREQSFPAIIAKKLKRENFEFKVLNAGRSGDSSFDGLNRLDGCLGKAIDIFVLELGINDIIRGVPAHHTKQNLDIILNTVRKKFPDCKLVILGMDAPDSIRTERIYAFRSASEIAAFKSLFRDLATLYQASLVPFFLNGVVGVRNLNLPDGIHPNSEGYKVIAEHVWPIIKQML